MDKVYAVVLEIEYEGEYIIGIYKSRDKAKQRIKQEGSRRSKYEKFVVRELDIID
ncbi:hypothetical protein TY_35 [Pseudomonas phage vB_PaeM_Ty]|nr:hypothetical protein TY_35 [Pseudomonas phage vB_PaeM_Ty]